MRQPCPRGQCSLGLAKRRHLEFKGEVSRKGSKADLPLAVCVVRYRHAQVLCLNLGGMVQRWWAPAHASEA